MQEGQEGQEGQSRRSSKIWTSLVSLDGSVTAAEFGQDGAEERRSGGLAREGEWDSREDH